MRIQRLLPLSAREKPWQHLDFVILRHVLQSDCFIFFPKNLQGLPDSNVCVEITRRWASVTFPALERGKT